MINNVVLIGRITKDPELRETQSGIAVCRFSLAINRTYDNSNGEKEADFVNCIAWRKQAENLATYMRKGNLIGVTGRIQTGSYEDKAGKRVYTTDVVAEGIQFLEPKRIATTSSQPPQQSFTSTQQPSPFHGTGRPELTDDDLPF